MLACGAVVNALIEVANVAAKGKTLSVADALPSHPLHKRDLMDNGSAKQTVPQSCSLAAFKQSRTIKPDVEQMQAHLLLAKGQACYAHVSCKNAFYLAESGADPFS